MIVISDEARDGKKATTELSELFNMPQYRLIDENNTDLLDTEL